MPLPSAMLELVIIILTIPNLHREMAMEVLVGWAVDGGGDAIRSWLGAVVRWLMDVKGGV